MSVRILCAALLLLLVTRLLSADVVELQDGSRLVGRIERISDGKLRIATGFAGVLEVDFAQLAAFSTEDRLFLAFESGNQLFGQVTHVDGKLEIHTDDGTMDITRAVLRGGWREGDTNPLLPPPPAAPAPRTWKYELSFDLSGKTGNSERLSLGGGAKASLDTDKDRLLLYVRGNHSEESGVRTADDLAGGIDYENRFSGRHHWYTRLELAQDRIQELQLRTTAAVGYGYYFLKGERHRLRGRVGVLYRHESYETGDPNSTPGLDVGLHHMLMVSDWGKLETDISYAPSFENLADYRVYHESALDVPLGRSDMWKLRLGVANDYTSMTVADVENLDTTYFARLVLGF